MKVESDIVAVLENIIITKDKRKQAWFRFNGFHSNFDSEVQLMKHFDDLKRLFKDLKKELHCLVVPVRQSLEDVRADYVKELRGNLKQVGEEHTNAVFSWLKAESELGAEENKVKYYVGVELDKSTIIDQSAEDMSYSEIFSLIGETFARWVNRAKGQETIHLSRDMLDSAVRSAKGVQNTLMGFSMNYEALSCDEMADILPWVFNFGIRHLPDHSGWGDQFTPIYGKGGEIVARVQTEEDVLKLQMTGIENPKSRRHLVLHQTDDHGVNHETKIAFLHMTGMPADIHFPEVRWLEPLRNMNFGVGVSMKMSYQDVDKRLGKLRRKKSNLEDQANHLQQFGESASSNVYEGIVMADETIAEVEKSREASYLMSTIFIVSAATYEELDRRIKDLIETYAQIGIKLQNTYGLQLRSLLECLPGSRRYVTEFIQDVDINAVTASFFGNLVELGDDYGAYMGRTTSGDPVFMRPGRAAAAKNLSQSLVTTFSGKTGTGKSMAGNSYLYESCVYGAKIMLLDPKSERKDLCHWDEKLTELGTELNFISFTSQDKDAGKLDPFLIFNNRQDAIDVSREIISYLLNISIRKDSEKSALVTKAVTRVAERRDPSIRFTKDELRYLAFEDEDLSEEHRKMAKDLANILEQFENVSLARLFFAERSDDSNRLDYTKQFNVLQVDNLSLPDKETDPDDYSEANIISVAILFGLTAYMMKFMRMFKDELTVIGVDEAWNFFQNAAGARLMQKLFREGRVLLSPVVIMTQNIKDIPKELRGQIGNAYCFRAEDKDEIQAIQELMRLEDTEGIEKMMPSLPAGYALYRDLDHRTGVMQFRILQDHLYDAFDTSRNLSEMAHA